MQKLLLLTVGIISAQAFNVERLPIMSKIMKQEPSNLALKQAAFPIPDIPDDFEVNGRYYQYFKDNQTLYEIDLSFNNKVSERWNSAVWDFKPLVSVNGGAKQPWNTTYFSAVNYTRGEIIEYWNNGTARCNTTKRAPASIDRMESEFWGLMTYQGIVNLPWNSTLPRLHKAST